MEETEVLKNVKRKNEKGVEELILKELEKDFNWKERIILKIFSKTINKLCNLCRIKIVNKMIEK